MLKLGVDVGGTSKARITSAGLRDVLEIGTQQRRALYGFTGDD